MNQIRCGSSLGITQMSEARKNICKGSGKAGHEAIRDPLMLLGGGSGKSKRWETVETWAKDWPWRPLVDPGDWEGGKFMGHITQDLRHHCMYLAFPENETEATGGLWVGVGQSLTQVLTGRRCHWFLPPKLSQAIKQIEACYSLISSFQDEKFSLSPRNTVKPLASHFNQISPILLCNLGSFLEKILLFPQISGCFI